MPEVTIPAAVRIANLEWSQPPSYAFNRSELTGKSRAVQLGPAARWSASGTLAPAKGGNARDVRGFLVNMALPDAFCRLPMVTTGQTVSGYPTVGFVNGAGQLGYALALDGLQPSVTNLKAGDIIHVVLDVAGDWQPIVLGADLVANGSGAATATLTTPLRKSPADNAGVQLNIPVATMRMRDPLRWSHSPGGIYQSEVSFEEAF